MELSFYGEFDPWPTKTEMEALLKKAGLTISAGVYSIHIQDCARFVFQQYGGDLGPPHIEVDADTPEQLLADVKLVSDALTQLKLRHRFEICGEGTDMVAYFHYDWPLPREQSSGCENR